MSREKEDIDIQNVKLESYPRYRDLIDIRHQTVVRQSICLEFQSRCLKPGFMTLQSFPHFAYRKELRRFIFVDREVL